MQASSTIPHSGAPRDHLHLYRPPHADFFCLEPVSHLPDAINREGMPAIAHGATLHLELTLTI